MAATWLLALLAISLTFLPATAIHSRPKQQPIQIPFTAQPQRVAIIGAGAAGSSTAYHLQQYAFNSTIPLSITIFESSPKIGGRSTTINALNNSEYPTEIGASIFAASNHILVDAAREFGLTTVEPSANRPKENKYDIGIWDGKDFVYKSARDDCGWWMDMAKLFWRYGLAPVKTQTLMKSTVARFLKMYEEPIFPWRNLTEVVGRTRLLHMVARTGRQLLQDNGIGERFGREVIQASTRVNYGQNLGLIHGLETMVCMATDGAMSVAGGNWRIFDGMVKRSQAEVRLNSSVEEIIRLENGGYRLLTNESEEIAQGKDTFDTVVIAAPLQYSGIKISPPISQPPYEIPYMTHHVTILASPYRPSPKFFSTSSNHEDNTCVPSMIITTLPPDLDPDLGSSRYGVGPTKFWSISTLRTVQVNDSAQYLYKIFSPESLTATFLSQVFDFSLNEQSRDDGTSSVGKEHVSWLYEKVWHSYPYEYPRVTFEEMNLDGKKLWYTAGMESLISTMETNALMGRNVARLIVDDLVEMQDREE